MKSVEIVTNDDRSLFVGHRYYSTMFGLTHIIWVVFREIYGNYKEDNSR